jgi:hypothetical protein
MTDIYDYLIIGSGFGGSVSGVNMKMNNGAAITSVFHPDKDTNV